MPDTSKAARYILKDYINAKLVYCHPPPGIDADDFMAGSRALTIKRFDDEIKAGKKKAPVTRVAKGADTFIGNTSSAPGSSTISKKQRQATMKSIRASAASAPGKSGAARGKGLDNDFFKEEGPSARPVAKGTVGAGLEGGYSRTKMYPHTQAIGNDGVPVQNTGVRFNHAMPTRDNGKKHFKIKEGKKRSGAGYD